MTSILQKEMPKSVEPPYADFFNSQLMRKVDLEILVAVAQAVARMFAQAAAVVAQVAQLAVQAVVAAVVAVALVQ